jgi:hypothetical protein
VSKLAFPKFALLIEAAGVKAHYLSGFLEGSHVEENLWPESS